MAVLVQNVDVESESLEKRNTVFALHFLEHNREFVIGQLVDKVTLESDDHVVPSKHWAKSVTLGTEEAESVPFKDQRIVESCLNRSLG